MSDPCLSLADIHALVERCLIHNGCDAANAEAVADTLTAAERDGCASHGLFRLPGYIASLRNDKVDGTADPIVDDLPGSVVRVDGKGGFAPLALKRGRAPLAERARKHGVAALSLVHIYHMAALWIEVEALASEGLCAFAFTASKPFVVPAGGNKPLFGTNPMAFAWPRPGRAPLVFDMATAAMARGEIMIAAREGHDLPPGTGVDADGQATTDPNAILAGGMSPMAGYKGSALALMVELLAGALIGENLSVEAGAADNDDGGPARGGELMIAIDPARFGDAAGWAEHGEVLFENMLAQSGVRLPGDRRYANRARTPDDGVIVPTGLHDQIVDLAG